jgi:GTP-binding protein LepA
MKNIRNFSIIAHIDHGKSTLSDRLIQSSRIISDRDFKDQILDTMDIERERGITIKSQTVCLPYKAKDGKSYDLNLIDTPGHVDFTYEVSRALASCEGALLLVDASQGVEAQTLANLYLALEHNLEIIPVINKIDLPSADIDRVKDQIEEDLGLDPETAILASAKEGLGIDDIMEAASSICCRHPQGDAERTAAGLDLRFPLRPVQGHHRPLPGQTGHHPCRGSIRFMSNNATYKVEEVGVFQIVRVPKKELCAGEVGYMIAGIKTVSDTRCGDTVTSTATPAIRPCPGSKKPNRWFFPPSTRWPPTATKT